MIKTVFNFDIDGALQDNPFLDRYELEYLFHQTRDSIEKALARKLSGLTCNEHNQEPTITITGHYDGEAEQLDIDYHIDTCCQMFMVQVIKMLNNIN